MRANQVVKINEDKIFILREKREKCGVVNALVLVVCCFGKRVMKENL